MKLFQINSSLNGSILFTLECESFKVCLEGAVKARAYLARADAPGTTRILIADHEE